MKEIYESPELELQLLLPEKKIASSDDLIAEEGLQPEIPVSDSDIEFPL